MARYLLIFLSLLVVASCESHVKHVKKIIHNHVKEHYHSNRGAALKWHAETQEETCPGFTEKLNQADIEFHECASKIDDYLTLCERAKSFFLNCTAPLIKVSDDCLPEDRRGLSSLLFQSIYSIIHHLCQLKGETLLELFRSCLWNDLQNSNEQLKKCAKFAGDIAAKYKIEGAKPVEVCKDIKQFRHCFKTRVDFTCKNPRLTDIFLGVYDAMEEPCKHFKGV